MDMRKTMDRTPSNLTASSSWQSDQFMQSSLSILSTCGEDRMRLISTADSTERLIRPMPSLRPIDTRDSSPVRSLSHSIKKVMTVQYSQKH